MLRLPHRLTIMLPYKLGEATMETQQIRRQFLKYFKEKLHAVISSSPVVPHDDPTLLFTNAGMNQFKDVFLGQSARDYTRAVTSQKCIRVGGKHNDLDNVGHTSRHLTFFEMLGNFSFGDYFKEEAIQFAWEVATRVYGFEPDRIWPTVFREDQEAFEMWRKYVPAERITRFDEKDNFWAMGDVGPCGPCSELLYDRGAEYGDARNPTEDKSGERYLEFWNLVFMQFNKKADGKMEALPKPSIDTGAGLERVVSLKMRVNSLFETDILRSLIGSVEEISGIKYDLHDHQLGPAFRVISDHLRCLSFAIADGVQPSNVDRGYVLRKVLRRAVRYGRMLGIEEPFLGKVLPRLVQLMGQDYPELMKSERRIAEILLTEEEAFIRTLKRGGNMLNQVMERSRSHGNQISGDDAFKLKDTYGLPFEEILLLAKDAELSVETERYQKLELDAKERSRSSQKVTQQVASESLFEDYLAKFGPCKFLGYKDKSALGKVTALIVGGKCVDEMQEGEEGMVLLDQTPFYADMGGQVGDTGTLKGDKTHFSVANCVSPFKGVIAHVGCLEKGVLRLGEPLVAAFDGARRQKIANNHTATHLLHWALHHVLGEHVKQAGSVVDDERLRFDFSHHKALTQKELYQIEDSVNEKIRENHSVRWYEIPYEEAKERGEIKQFFGEKYGSRVRVIDIDFSKELCGGTHVEATGNIGLFKIAKEGSIAAGVRRIEAVTGAEAEKFSRQPEEQLGHLATLLKTQTGKLVERVEKMVEENKTMAQELKEAKRLQLEQIIHSLLNKIEKHDHISALFQNVSGSVEDLRICADELMGRTPSLALVLAATFPEKCHVIVRFSDDLVAKGNSAQSVIKAIAPIIEGSGGGRANSAEAGGKSPVKLPEAFAKARELIK